jgi:CxxC-x17-CxxC domain-containing protein
MTDDNTQLTEKPVDETEEPVVAETTTEEPKAEEVKAEEPKTEEPVSGPTAPTDNTVTPSSTDPMGRQLYNIKCAKCGKDAQVPFKPSGDRPVYCRDCYAQQRQER